MVNEDKIPDHWARGEHDDQSILYRIADLLEAVLDKLEEIRKEQKEHL